MKIYHWESVSPPAAFLLLELYLEQVAQCFLYFLCSFLSLDERKPQPPQPKWKSIFGVRWGDHMLRHPREENHFHDTPNIPSILGNRFNRLQAAPQGDRLGIRPHSHSSGAEGCWLLAAAKESQAATEGRRILCWPENSPLAPSWTLEPWRHPGAAGCVWWTSQTYWHAQR